MNDQIRGDQVRLVSEDGEPLGVMHPKDAISIAEERDYDLVEVAPEANPPVCKLMDYSKYKYELRKRDKEAKKKQHTIQVKEIRFRPRIEDHDFNTKMKKAREFLEAKNKVKITVMFRGREMSHLEFGDILIERIVEGVEDIAVVATNAKREGRFITMFLMPK